MTTSSQPVTYSITSGSSDTITFDNISYDSISTITLDTTSLYGAGQPIYTVGNSSVDTITITGGSVGSSFVWKMPEEWVDTFPAWSRIEDMCRQYPGLKVAFENFKTVYQLVKDDYDSPKDEK